MEQNQFNSRMDNGFRHCPDPPDPPPDPPKPPNPPGGG